MMRALIVFLALAACGTGAKQAQPAATMALSSPAFSNGQPIPTRFTCDGDKASPPLSWDKVPAGTKSFALVLEDPDAPGRTFRHWGAYGIPASARSIGEGERPGKEAVNDFGRPGYGAPCPPPGHGVHHYRFNLLALDTDALDLGSDASVSELESAASRHKLGQAELTGTFERQ